MLGGGLLGATLGILAWFGRYRYWLRWYDNPAAPFYVRGAGLTLIPSGIGFALLGLGRVLGHSGDRWTGASMLCAGGFFALTLASVLIDWYRPPWSKPGWLRKRDKERPPLPSVNDDRFLFTTSVWIFSAGTLWFFFIAAIAP